MACSDSEKSPGPYRRLIDMRYSKLPLLIVSLGYLVLFVLWLTQS